jgi:Integrase core domain
MGIQPVLSAPRSPGQRAYVERGIGTIRRECLAPVMVFREAGLSRHLPKFADSYQRSRRHLGLQKDTPESRRCKHHKPGGSSRSQRWWAASSVPTSRRLNRAATPS